MLAGGCGPSKAGTAGTPRPYSHSSRPSVNPSVPQSGGLRAATTWLRDNAQYQPVPIPWGDLLFSSQGLQRHLRKLEDREMGTAASRGCGNLLRTRNCERRTAVLLARTRWREQLDPIPVPVAPDTTAGWHVRRARGSDVLSCRNGRHLRKQAERDAELNQMANGVEVGFGPESNDPGAFFATTRPLHRRRSPMTALRELSFSISVRPNWTRTRLPIWVRVSAAHIPSARSGL